MRVAAFGKLQRAFRDETNCHTIPAPLDQIVTKSPCTCTSWCVARSRGTASCITSVSACTRSSVAPLTLTLCNTLLPHAASVAASRTSRRLSSSCSGAPASPTKPRPVASIVSRAWASCLGAASQRQNRRPRRRGIRLSPPSCLFPEAKQRDVYTSCSKSPVLTQLNRDTCLC